MDAIFVNSSSFTIIGDYTDSLTNGIRLQLNCDTDGILYGTVYSSLYSSPNTIVTIKEAIITPNLLSILIGIISSGTTGSLPDHYHTSSNGDGGLLDYSTSFISLIDTPSDYSNGKYLTSTTSGITYTTLSLITSFIGLYDSPGGYDSGKFLQSTTSGTIWTSISGVTYSLISLTDCPSYYSNGAYLQSTTTGSQWTIPSFINLSDTPKAYSSNQVLVSTTSGISFQSIILYGTGSPPSAVGVTDGTLYIKYTN